MIEITETIEFTAAHGLRNYESDGSDEPIHSHVWKVTIGISFEKTNKAGIAIDFLLLKEIFHDTVITPFNNKSLNETPPFTTMNPTTENIAKTFFETIKPKLPAHQNLWVQVWETPTSSARYFLS
ncbi:MAG: 6-carboxytetrahydropterin synthase [bacterium]